MGKCSVLDNNKEKIGVKSNLITKRKGACKMQKNENVRLQNNKKKENRCKDNCKQIMEEDDPRYFKEGQLLENAKCVGKNCKTVFDNRYLRSSKVYYCKNFPDDCNFVVCVKCLPVRSRKRGCNNT